MPEMPFQLVLLPGVGADHRLLNPQRTAFPQATIPPWIPFRRREVDLSPGQGKNTHRRFP
jgi:hypothetical protein